jgi:hypothetical protein
MPWPNDYILYAISVEDVREAIVDEGLRELTDDEIKAIGDKLGDYINWYDALLIAIQEVAPDVLDSNEEEEDD